jgi:hypothetical protein
MERDQLGRLIGQLERVADSRTPAVLTGDLNLNTQRRDDRSYPHHQLLSDLTEATDRYGFEYIKTAPTWRSHGAFTDKLGDTGQRESTIDHVYVAGVAASVKVLEDSSTDHRPLLTCLRIGGPKPKLVPICRRNFKGIDRATLELALEGAADWGLVYRLRDADKIDGFIHDAIVKALDRVAPFKTMHVRPGKHVVLASDTLERIRQRDKARGAAYRYLRNRCAAMVKRDKRASNLSEISKARGDPRALWELANRALGKDRPPLPASIVDSNGKDTVGREAAAECLAKYYVDKVLKLREANKGCPPPPPSDWPKRLGQFSFKFSTAGRVAKVIRGVGTSEALGADGIPISIYKKGAEVLAGPLSHLVNMSLATGVVPVSHKLAIVRPVYKGGNKNRRDPASYRPVALLPAVSKILEVIVKQDLEEYLSKIDGLPTSQHGFRPGRSCTTALAAAHAGWLKSRAESKVVAIAAFDLTAAFDTLDPAELLPKLTALGIKGVPLKWLSCYMEGGSQVVDWDGARSKPVAVLFGVRQGSILGPLLFLIHVASLSDTLEHGSDNNKNKNGSYADDSHAHEVGATLVEALNALTCKANRFACWAKGNGLALNGGKTQLLIVGGGREAAESTITVDGKVVNPSVTLELLGARVDRQLSFRPHDKTVAIAARSRASLIRRLSNHLPPGEYLRQLATGLVVGKLSHAIAAVTTIRFSSEDSMPDSARVIQTALNDVARSIVGAKRSDRVRVEDLLESAGVPSHNRLAAAAIATEAWKSFHSRDGENGCRNPVGEILYSSHSSRPLRTAGEIRVPLRGYKSFVGQAAEIWNRCPELRSARLLMEAKKVAKTFACGLPV